MASPELNPYKLVVEKGPRIILRVGVQGPPGSSVVEISPDPGNGLTLRENGLYVATDLGTFN